TGTVRFLNAENFWADWSPYASTALSQIRLERQVYDSLVDFPTGDLGQPEPVLATDWRQIDDLTWEFDIRDGVKFHDGQDLTAEDVKASVEFASNPDLSAYSLLWLPAQVEVVDRLTARISTEKPFAPILPQLWFTPILSAEWLANPVTAQPNGTGAFRLVEDTVDVKTMESNLDYWRDPPRIKTLIWEFIQDPQTRLDGFLAGQAEVLDRVPPQHLPILAGEAGVEVKSFTAVESVNFYVRPGRFPLWEENLNFRRAVNWSFDREPLVDNLVLGKSAVARSLLPSNTQFFAPQEPLYRFDPAKVEEELAAGGITDGGPEFEIQVPEGFQPRSVEVTEAAVAQMQSVGLNPKIVVGDVAAIIDDVFSETGTGAMYHLSWATNGDPDAASQVYSARFAWWFGDETLQGLIEQGQATVDPGARKQVYADLQQHMWEQVWHVPLYNSDFTLAHSANLQGLIVQPNVLRTDFQLAELT
ncbi:MAG: ABC transporter substrate-binding protein, partial [Acidimicrobiia bacterium]